MNHSNKKNLRDKKNKKIVLTEGIEVVKLTKVLEEGLYTEIIVWLERVYYRGFILSGALGLKDADNEISDENLLKSFLNDVEHTIFRVESEIDFFNPQNMPSYHVAYKNKPKDLKVIVENYLKKLDNIFLLLKKVKEAVKLLKTKKLKLNNELIFKIQQKQNILLEILQKNIGEGITAIETNFHEHYLPNKNSSIQTLKDVVIVAPLTRRWFLGEHDEVKIIFDSVLKNSDITWEGTSGELLHSSGKTGDSFIEAVKLLKLKIDILAESAEKKWINQISIPQLKSAEAIIVLQDGGLDFDFSTIFAAEVSVLQQFSTLKIIPLQTLIAHEINMSPISFSGKLDSHLGKDDCEKAYNEVSTDNQININKVQKNSPNQIDFIYQSDAFLELININYVLDELNALQ
jgi:hypothetical protein